MADTFVETGKVQVIKAIVLRHIVKIPKIKFGRTPRKWHK